MSPRLVGCIFVVLAVVWPAGAKADVGVRPETTVVPVGGVIHGWGVGSGMPVYLVPAAAGPRRFPCHGNGICAPSVVHAPQRPFVLVGRLRRTRDPYARQWFDFRVPATLPPGGYRMYLYCVPCGRTLIQSGPLIEGETLRVTTRPTSRTVEFGPGASRRQFLVSEPDGVVLLLRLTVPHGTRAYAIAAIPGVAAIQISTEEPGICRRSGANNVCTQPVEWCPMPAAAWRLRLHKSAGPAGAIRLDFIVGKPPDG